jgi:hypothetical protein
MSTTSLSIVQELIERSLFEAIRKEVVDKGYLPDITLYPNTPIGYQDYEDDKATIIATKGFAIDIYNEGSNMAKEVKKAPRIVINTGNFLPGALGGDPQREFIDLGLTYRAQITPPQTVDFYLNVHLVSVNVIQERILNALMALALPRRGYIPHYNDPEETLFCRYLNFYNMDDSSMGIMEKVYAYEVPDCFDREPIIPNEGNYPNGIVAKITEISVHPNIIKYIEGSWGSVETDPLIIRYTPKGIINALATVSGTLREAPPN